MLIDEFDAEWLEELDCWARELSDDHNLYLLIDGVFVPGIWQAFAAAAQQGTVSLLFETLPSCTHEIQDASPFMLRYDPGNESLRKVLKQCSGWPMVSVLETGETQERLFARLAAWCIVENDGQRFNFRFPDTRRLPGIFRALNLEQQGQLAGPAKCWRYIGREGRWSSFEMLAPASPAKVRPQKLDDNQFGRMVADSDADEAISHLNIEAIRCRGGRRKSMRLCPKRWCWRPLWHSTATSTLTGAAKALPKVVLPMTTRRCRHW